MIPISRFGVSHGSFAKTAKAQAVREGSWKFVRTADSSDELYDLSADVGETKNLASEKPEVASRLAVTLDGWSKEMIAPVFLGSSVKNEDWGPSGANQKNAPSAARAKVPTKK